MSTVSGFGLSAFHCLRTCDDSQTFQLLAVERLTKSECLDAVPALLTLARCAADVKYVHKKQSGGSGQFADVQIKFAPGEPGSGFTFKSEIKGGVIPKEYIPGVVKGLEECMSNGALAGYPVVDLEAVLYDGNYHDVDSSVLAFQIAARGAFREGMRQGKCKLKEPIMKVRHHCVLRQMWHSFPWP